MQDRLVGSPCATLPAITAVFWATTSANGQFCPVHPGTWSWQVKHVTDSTTVGARSDKQKMSGMPLTGEFLIVPLPPLPAPMRRDMTDVGDRDEEETEVDPA